MKFNTNIASLLLGLMSASSGWIVWWVTKINNDKITASQKAADAATKAYAAQRDFEHLKNNLKQMSDAISDGFDEIDHRFNDVDKELLRLQGYIIQRKATEDNNR